MDLMIVTAVLSICCLCASASPADYRNTDDILRFEPMTPIDNVWEAFKAEYG